jgi:hypothetical protein
MDAPLEPDASAPTEFAWPDVPANPGPVRLDTQLAGPPGVIATAGTVPGRLIGLQGRLARLFWGLLGIWSAVCGALASNQVRWTGADLLALALVLLLTELAWGSFWDLLVGIDLRRLGTGQRAPAQPPRAGGLPYTQPDSPGGRISLGLGRLASWWRGVFWPGAGPALLGSLAAVALAAVLSLLLPERVLLLNAALLALTGLGVIQRRWGRAPLAVQAMVLVGLSWLAGHAVFAEVSRPSLILALAFTAAAWGALRAAAGQRRGLWLLDGGQIIAVALLAVLKQPLAAGLAGLLLFGQLALQPALRAIEGPAPRAGLRSAAKQSGEAPFGDPVLGPGVDPALLMRRAWPWLLAAMLVAAWALT